MINSKDQIVKYFNSGIKETKNFKIGIEHEKFLFNNSNNKRLDYPKIKEMFAALLEFGWNPIYEKGNIIGWVFISQFSINKITYVFHSGLK